MRKQKLQILITTLVIGGILLMLVPPVSFYTEEGAARQLLLFFTKGFQGYPLTRGTLHLKNVGQSAYLAKII